MSTGQYHVKMENKKLLGLSDLKERLLDYLKSRIEANLAVFYREDGSVGVKHDFSASQTDRFDLDTGVESTDGLGHVMKLDAALGEGIYFENENGIVYDVGLRYSERYKGIRINPRTGLPEYEYIQETVGEKADPDAVVDDGDGTMTVTVDSVCESGVSNAGRKCLVYLKTPADGGVTEAIAIEELTVQWLSGANKITTAGALGQATISTTVTDYEVVLLGPTVRRNTDLSATGLHFFVGEITGKGAGNVPDTWDTSGQTLVQPYSGDIICDSLEATCTTTNKTAIKGTGGPNQGIGIEGIGAAGPGGAGGSTGGLGGEATGGAGGDYDGGGWPGATGFKATGGAGGGGTPDGGNGGSGLHGIGGAGGDGANPGAQGYGVVAESDTSTPGKTSFRMVPQDARAGLPVEGDMYSNSSEHNVEAYDGSRWLTVAPSYTSSNVSNPPTDAELDTLYSSPAIKGAGWYAWLSDSDSDNLYLVSSDGNFWYTFAGVKAV